MKPSSISIGYEFLGRVRAAADLDQRTVSGLIQVALSQVPSGEVRFTEDPDNARRAGAKIISVSMPPSIWEEASRSSRRLHLTRSSYVRRAVARYLRTRNLGAAA